MSAPNTNLKTEAKRHRPALIGIAIAVLFVAVLFTVWIVFILTPDVQEVEEGVDPTGIEQAAPIDEGVSQEDAIPDN